MARAPGHEYKRCVMMCEQLTLTPRETRPWLRLGVCARHELTSQVSIKRCDGPLPVPSEWQLWHLG